MVANPKIDGKCWWSHITEEGDYHYWWGTNECPQCARGEAPTPAPVVGMEKGWYDAVHDNITWESDRGTEYDFLDDDLDTYPVVYRIRPNN